MPTPLRTLALAGIGLLLTLIVAFASLSIGSYGVAFSDIVQSLLSLSGWAAEPLDETATLVILKVRLPRVLLALLAGGCLSVSGVVFQVLLRNVLADPYILGVSGGASVGALIAIGTGLATTAMFALPVSAFIGAALVVTMVYVIGGSGATINDNSLLLSGVMIGAFLSAIILALVATIGDAVRNALFWLIGYMGNATMEEVLIVAATSLPVLVYFIYSGHRLNILALGGETAEHLGLNTKKVSLIMYAGASLLTAVVVSFTGSIGFVGLIIPHIARMIFGADHRVLIPMSFFTGASFMIISDIVARTVIAPAELPVGAVTAALGAPLFMYLLRKRR